ncbi:hypothetical protein B0A48_16181 [Cryoendolithus antarcticus]|uniref:Uncharacterized protein n=1 Tax=Cryoendolithus antarcticus TaxID=1507870 RepID=A0A1V8SFW6_9PEZI|nr:hypothetical protein B0A48_16181 [Cryoendolithus antarcticus]
MTKPSGRLFPVCCIADVSAEFKERFIQVNQDYHDQVILNVVFVDSITATYTEESEIDECTPSASDSPFKGKSVHECYLLLRRLRQETESDIDPENFAILDEQSLQDDTVLLAQGPYDGGVEAVSVRVTMEMVNMELLCYITGDSSVQQGQEASAEAVDGVYRYQ